MKFEVLPSANVVLDLEEDTKKTITVDLKIEEELDNNVPVPKTRISSFLK